MTGMQVAFFAGTFGLLAALQGAGAQDGSRLVRDGAERTVRVPSMPARIVSLAPSVTEILFALGAGDRVVGVTDFCDYPAQVVTRARIGGLINPDLEKIVSLKPDLAIATTSGNYQDDVERIQRLGIPVYTISAPTVEAVLATLEQVGGLIQAERTARELTGRLRVRLDRVRTAASLRSRKRTLFIIEPSPLIAPGRDTFIGEALALAGADLVTAGAPSSWAQLDLEQVIGMRPEVLLTSEANRAWSRTLSTMAEWSGVPAVSTGRIFIISDSIQHPGPRLVDGIEEVAEILAGLAAREGAAGGAERGGARQQSPELPLRADPRASRGLGWRGAAPPPH